MRRLLVAVVVLGVVGVSCTTGGTGGGGGGGVTLPPAPLLDGWVKIGRAPFSAIVGDTPVGPTSSQGIPDVRVSPNGRYVVWETDETFAPDVDSDPSQSNLYELDRDTGVHHLIASSLATGLDVRDDGAVLVSYRSSPVDVLHRGVYTVDTGIVALSVPMDPTGCRMRFERGGTGFELRCNATATRALGLYRFDIGDVAATPVAVVPNLPSDRWTFVSVSANHQYVEYSDENSDLGHYWVYDEQSAATLPYRFVTLATSVSQPTNTAYQFRNHEQYTEAGIPVGDDGRLAITRGIITTVVTSEREMWFDPHDGSRTPWVGFPTAMAAAGSYPGTNYFLYMDDSGLIGHNFILDHVEPPEPLILGDLNSPTIRWQLPYYFPSVVNVDPDGDVFATSAATTAPGETYPEVDVMMRVGPLP
jgi:hypothetical protein